MPTGVTKRSGGRGGRSGGQGRGGSGQRFSCNRCKGNHWAQDCPVGRIKLCEFFDAQGLKDARSDLDALEPKNDKERLRKQWISDYLDKVDKAYGKEDANGLRWQHVSYWQRCDSKGKPAGRHTARGANGPAYSDGTLSKPLLLQGMLRELRGYGVGPSARRGRKHGRAHDLDFKICQPAIFSQLPELLSWADGRAPPSVKEIVAFCNDRDDLFKELATHHSLDPDSAHYDGYQKDLLKKLTTSLFFGGSYGAWIWRQKLPQIKAHPRVSALEEEIKLLRVALFESEQWASFVAEWREVLKVEKKGDAKAIDRSIMARIAQHLEDRCLLAMKAQLEEDGWTVRALIYDGSIVEHRKGHDFNFARLQERILKDTKLKMTIEEKPLFDAEPKLILTRDIGCDADLMRTCASTTSGNSASRSTTGSSSGSMPHHHLATSGAKVSAAAKSNKSAQSSEEDEEDEEDENEMAHMESNAKRCEKEERKSARAAMRDERKAEADAEDVGSQDSESDGQGSDSDLSDFIDDGKIRKSKSGHALDRAEKDLKRKLADRDSNSGSEESDSDEPYSGSQSEGEEESGSSSSSEASENGDN